MLKTWDIFDTLIARRCIFPQNIFQIVEQIAKVKGFKEVRIAAEQLLIKNGINYNFDDIYDKLTQITKAPPEIIKKLKQLELDVEMEQVIPINENLNQVQSGDILISDMYLPEHIIRKMLDKVGLFVPVEVVVTSGGKSSGKIWKQIKDQNIYLFHIGDNKISDVANPRKFNFDSSIVLSSQLNQFENFLLNKDFNFATYLRELRLKNPFSEEGKQIYWMMFVMNIGILMLFIQIIDKIQKNYNFDYLGFCGRDVYYMYLLYKKFKQDNNEALPDCDYLYFSRKLILNSEKDMAKYYSSKIKNKKALLIDLYGTGAHLSKLRHDMKLHYSIMICKWLGYGRVMKFYPKMKFMPDWINVGYDNNDQKLEKDINFCIVDLQRENFPVKDHLELVNRATHNSPIRMKSIKVNEDIIPELIFTEVNDTENLDVFEICMREIFKSKMTFPDLKNVIDIISLLKELLPIFNSYADKLIFKNQHNIQEAADNFVQMYERIIKLN